MLPVNHHVDTALGEGGKHPLLSQLVEQPGALVSPLDDGASGNQLDPFGRLALSGEQRRKIRVQCEKCFHAASVWGMREGVFLSSTQGFGRLRGTAGGRGMLSLFG